MATHSSTLAWKIPWMEKLGRLQSIGLQSRTRLSNFPGKGESQLCCVAAAQMTTEERGEQEGRSKCRERSVAGLWKKAVGSC